MAQGPVDFAGGQASGNEPLAGAIPLTVNLLVDGTGCMFTRPGISTWADFPTAIPSASPVDGMVAFGDYLVYVTRDRKLWAVTSPGTVTALSSATVTTQLDGSTRPVSLATKSRVVFAGGGAPQKWEGAGLAARLLGLDTSPPFPTGPPSPPPTTHLASVATRLLACDRSISGPLAGQIYWSNTLESGNEVWDPINFLELSSRPDRVVALYDNTNQVFGFGEASLEIIRPDPNQGFVSARALPIGCAAPYSPTLYDDSMIWFDPKRRFMISSGSDYSEISGNLKATLEALTVTNDAWGFEFDLDSWRQPTWVFPTDGRCFTWNADGGRWSELKSFSTTGYIPLNISSSYQWKTSSKNINLVGLPSGQIAKWDPMAVDDLGAAIKSEAQTGYVNRGTTKRKKCNELALAFRRGSGDAGGAEPIIQVSWRDDSGAFGQPVVVGLGAPGDSAPVVRMRSLGTYRMRQWRIEFTGSAKLVFVGAVEDYDVLDI